MIERLKSAFGSVHAPDEAKQKALYAVNAHRKNTVRRRISSAVQITCACVTAVLVIVCLNIYGSETAYISLDVNPSISMAINDYGRVITATAYGAESQRVLDSIRVDGKPYLEAVETVITASDMEPYLQSDRTVWIAVQAKNPLKEAEMEQTVEAAVQSALASSHPDMDIAHHAVSEEVRVTAEDAGVTATRYIAISELQAVDPSASIDSYRHTAIWEIHEQTASHHAESGNSPAPDSNPAIYPDETAEPMQTPEPTCTPQTHVEQTPAPAAESAHGHHEHGAEHH